MKREELFELLQNSITLRNQEHNTWINTLFMSLTTNSLLLIALFKDGKFPDDSSIGIIISAFGILLTIFLLSVHKRAMKTMGAYEAFSRKVEKKLKLKEFSYNRFRDEKLINSKGTIRKLTMVFEYLILTGWVVFLIFFVLNIQNIH
jgi:hypothetical protein